MKHIELFTDGFDLTIDEKIKPENYPYVGHDVVSGEIVYTIVSEIVDDLTNSEIWYTTNDNQLISTNIDTIYNVINHTYENGKGVIEFDSVIDSIPYGAFIGCTFLSSITIPNSVTSIGNSAFYQCSSLSSITIPNSVTSIGHFAFADCSSLASITIPNSVTSIGDHVFLGCSSLTSVILSNSITIIEGYAFKDCSSLTSITIPNSVTSIGSFAFEDCSSLTSIIFEGTIEEWNNVNKNSGWFNAPVTYVQCSDGQVEL